MDANLKRLHLYPCLQGIVEGCSRGREREEGMGKLKDEEKRDERIQGQKDLDSVLNVIRRGFTGLAKRNEMRYALNAETNFRPPFFSGPADWFLTLFPKPRDIQDRTIATQ